MRSLVETSTSSVVDWTYCCVIIRQYCKRSTESNDSKHVGERFRGETKTNSEANSERPKQSGSPEKIHSQEAAVAN